MNREELEALAEASFQADATPERVAHEMADLIRDLIRAASSENDNGSKAAQQMETTMRYVTRCSEPISWWRIFSDALGMIRANLPENKHDSKYLNVATSGMKFFVESTAVDNFAKGRAVQRLGDLQNAIRWLEPEKAETPEEKRISDLLNQNAMKLGQLK